MLAFYDVAHSLLLEGAGRDFSFTEDEIRRHFSYLSGIFRELYYIPMPKYTLLQRDYMISFVTGVGGGDHPVLKNTTTREENVGLELTQLYIEPLTECYSE